MMPLPVLVPQPEIKLEFDTADLQSTVKAETDIDDLGTTVADFDHPESDLNLVTKENQDEKWYFIDQGQWYECLEDPEISLAFPVDRATRPIAADEMRIHAKPMYEARCKELQSC